MNLSIRHAKTTDADAITRVHIASWQKGYHGIIPEQYLQSPSFEQREERWRYYLNNKPESSWLLIVEDGSNLLGFCNYQSHSNHPDFDMETYEILAIYCHPDAWGSGAASCLMNETLSRQQKALCFLWALKENQRAKRFYDRFSFIHDGKEKMYEIGGTEYPIIRYMREGD